MEIINPLIAFNLGLFSTLHCLGMCGGIIGALSLSAPANTDAQPVGRAGLVFAYNIGRVFSYTLAGAIAGFFGEHLMAIIMPDSGHRALQFIAAVILILIGLHLAGWLLKLRLIEASGLRLWQLIQPAGRRFFPVNNLSKALMIGMVWGWLPCALVYSAMLWSLASGNAWNGALLMFAFGLGTLPGMMTAGLMGNRLLDVLKQKAFRTWAGVIIILFGAASPFIYTVPHQHEHGQELHSRI
jgi:sulfite exporter TauE/SafE